MRLVLAMPAPIVIGVCASALCVLAVSGHAGSQALIARYPLESDAIDVTGNNDPMTLVNAGFEEGAVYCNGIYDPEPGGYRVETPYLAGLDFESFSISALFRIGADHDRFRPVLVGGDAYRWMGAELQADGTIGLLYNNSTHVTSDVMVTRDAWHRVHVVYDGSIDTGSLYLDDELVLSELFVLVAENDRDISTTNYANGTAFKGHFKDLRVYDSAFVPTPVGASTWGRIKAIYGFD